jgi:hypothetical protein
MRNVGANLAYKPLLIGVMNYLFTHWKDLVDGREKTGEREKPEEKKPKGRGDDHPWVERW